MRRFKAISRLLLAGAFALLSNINDARAQSLTVENVRTDNFPELRFDVRADDNLVANKARLVVKDNYVVVTIFRVAAGKASGTGGGSFIISYNVPDPERLDGTTTFEYRGKSITTTYLVKKPTPEQEKAYPKEERSNNTLLYVIGGFGIVAGITGFLLSRRNRRRHTADASEQSIPTPPAPQPPVAVAEAPLPAPVAPAPSPTPEDAYKPRQQSAPASMRVAETMVSPGLMPTITIRINERTSILTANGALQKIGRSPECDLIIPHPTVSKVHASIQLQNGTWWIEDLGSTNGTYANGQRITRAPLYDGSKLYFGQVTGAFNLPQ